MTGRRPTVVLVTAVTIAMTFLGAGRAQAAPPSTGVGDWLMFMDGPAHNGDNRAETVLSPSNVGGLAVTHQYTSWRPLTAEEGANPVVRGSVGASVVVGQGHNLRLGVFSLPGGRARWRSLVYTGDPLPATPGPAIDSSSGDLYVGVGNVLDAFTPTGQLLWSMSTPEGSFNELTLAKGVLYADLYSSTVQALAINPSNGSTLWSQSVSGCCTLGAVGVANGIAYVEGSDLWAFNAITGAPVFDAPAGAAGGTPAISGGVVYVETVTTLEAFSASTGHQIWSSPTVSGNSFSTLDPAVDGSTVIAATPQYVIAFNASTGSRLWTHDGGSAADYSAPAIANGVVYASSISNGLQVFNEATGALLASVSSDCYGGPIVTHGSVYAGCNGIMEAFSTGP